jgi:hypothetical protein
VTRRSSAFRRNLAPRSTADLPRCDTEPTQPVPVVTIAELAAEKWARLKEERS